MIMGTSSGAQNAARARSWQLPYFDRGLNKFVMLCIHSAPMGKALLGLIGCAYFLALVAMLVMSIAGFSGLTLLATFWLGGSALVLLLPALTDRWPDRLD